MDRWLLELIGQRRQHAAVRGAHRAVGQRIGRQGGGRHGAGESQQQDEGEACVTGHPGRVTSLGSVATNAIAHDRIGPHPTDQHSP